MSASAPIASAADDSVPQTLIRTTLDLPTDLLGHFEAHALVAGQPVGEFIVAHLAATQYHLEPDGMWLSGVQASGVRALLGGAINSADKLLLRLRSLMMLAISGERIGNLSIKVSTPRQEALISRAKAKGRPLSQSVAEDFNEMMAEKLGC